MPNEMGRNDTGDGEEQLSGKSDEAGPGSRAGPGPEGGAESDAASPDEGPVAPLASDHDKDLGAADASEAAAAPLDAVEVSASPEGEEGAGPAMPEPPAEDGTVAAPAEGAKALAPAGGRKGPPAPAPESFRIGPAGSTLLVRHGLMRTVGQFRHELASIPAPGTKVVIRTDRGVEMGEAVVGVGAECSHRCTTPEALGRFLRACAGAYPLRSEGTVLRVANAQDLIDYRHLETGAHEEAAYCRQQIRDLGLKMRLVTVERTLGGERILFYFTSEQRVDFRELVRRLATQYRTRIEMRQVGARDEARVAADYERCGQQCCCQAFLKELQPVSMRMAKVQKATLDPSKISGRCGRLMCCLRYEDLTYEDLRKKLPHKNIWVRTADRVGRVIETQILTQLVRLALPDGTAVAVPNESILERDVPAPALPAPPLGPPPRGQSGGRTPPQGSPGPGPGAGSGPGALPRQPSSRGGPPDNRRGGRVRQWPKSGPVGESRTPAEASQPTAGAPSQPTGAAEAPPAGGASLPNQQPPTGPGSLASRPDLPAEAPAQAPIPQGAQAIPGAPPTASALPMEHEKGAMDLDSLAGDDVEAPGAEPAPAGPSPQAGGRPPQVGGRAGAGSGPAGGGRPGPGSPQGAGSSQGAKSHHRHRRRGGGRGNRPPQPGRAP